MQGSRYLIEKFPCEHRCGITISSNDVTQPVLVVSLGPLINKEFLK